MTPEEIRKLAGALLGDYGVDVPHVPHALIFNRMSSRQRELFSWAATIDPDYFGECAVATLVGGDANLDSLELLATGPYPVDTIQIVRIHDSGNSEYETGDRVRIVREDDHRDLPPRMTYRSRALRGVGNDMDGVVSIKVWYTRRPRPIGIDGSGVIELPEPWHDLLALDIAQFLLARSPGVHAEAASGIEAEKVERMANFEAHIRASYRALEARFG